MWPINIKAVDRTILSKDTESISKFVKYDIVQDKLPIANIQGRDVRSLLRDKHSLDEVRAYRLVVNSPARLKSLDEKQKNARRFLIDVGPQR